MFCARHARERFFGDHYVKRGEFRDQYAREDVNYLTMRAGKVFVESLREAERLIRGHYAKEGDFMQQYAREVNQPKRRPIED